MLFANSKTWMSILLACSSMLSVQCAPTSGVELISARDIKSPLAIVPPITTVDTRDISDVITARDAMTDVALAKRYLIGSPYQKRAIKVILKQTINGLAAGTTWLWEISYKYSTINGGNNGQVTGNIVAGTSGTFDFTGLTVKNYYIESSDCTLSASFRRTIGGGADILFKLSWEELFTSKGARITNSGITSAFEYIYPSGHTANFDQSFFSYTLLPETS